MLHRHGSPCSPPCSEKWPSSTPRQQRYREREHEVDEKRTGGGEEDDETWPPMVAVVAAGLPVLGCCESNIGKN